METATETESARGWTCGDDGPETGGGARRDLGEGGPREGDVTQNREEEEQPKREREKAKNQWHLCREVTGRVCRRPW